jgi:hypothetical protein
MGGCGGCGYDGRLSEMLTFNERSLRASLDPEGLMCCRGLELEQKIWMLLLLLLLSCLNGGSDSDVHW